MPGFPFDFKHVRFRYEAWPPLHSMTERMSGDGQADEWLKEVRKVLWHIYSHNYTGLSVIDAIRTNSRNVTVIVTPSEAAEKSPTEVQVEYNPFSCTGKNGCRMEGLQADEVLIHELAHAWRKANGTDTADGPLEEFFAILIADIYMSEKGRGPLRTADYMEYVKGAATQEEMSQAEKEGMLRPGNMRPEWSTSRGFLSEHRSYAKLRRLCGTEMELFQRIRFADRPSFNPIREYLMNRPMWDRKMLESFDAKDGKNANTKATVRESDKPRQL
jgi:hypothetical protein